MKLNKISAAALVAAGLLSLGAVNTFAQSSPTPSPTPSFTPVPFSSSAQAKLIRIFGTATPSAGQLTKYAKSHPGQAGNISVTLGEAGYSGSSLSAAITALGNGVAVSSKNSSAITGALTLLYTSALNVAPTSLVQGAFASVSIPSTVTVNIPSITGPTVSGTT